MKKKLNNKRKAIHKQYSISNIVKKEMTTRSDLEFMASKLGIEPIRIVWLKDADPNYKGAQIINLGNPYGVSGSHWTATYNGMYFDSFGLIPPQKFEDYNYQWTPLQLQDPKFGYCGNYVILWLYYAKKNELDQFYNLFTAMN
jgi:hypothetical protein